MLQNTSQVPVIAQTFPAFPELSIDAIGPSTLDAQTATKLGEKITASHDILVTINDILGIAITSFSTTLFFFRRDLLSKKHLLLNAFFIAAPSFDDSIDPRKFPNQEASFTNLYYALSKRLVTHLYVAGVTAGGCILYKLAKRCKLIKTD